MNDQTAEKERPLVVDPSRGGGGMALLHTVALLLEQSHSLSGLREAHV